MVDGQTKTLSLLSFSIVLNLVDNLTNLARKFFITVTMMNNSTLSPQKKTGTGRKRTHADVDNNVSEDNKENEDPNENEKPKAAAEEDRIESSLVVKGINGVFDPHVVLDNAATKEQLGDRHTLGLLLMGTLVERGLRIFLLSRKICKESPKKFLEEIARVNLEKGLFFVGYPSRNCSSSGYSRRIGLDRLNAITTVDFKAFFKLINSYGHKINKAWLVQFLEGGEHDFHPDKGFDGTHRWIISLGCHGKRFGFKMNGIEVGLRLQHGSVIVLNEATSGLTDRAIKHAGIGDVQGSVSVVFETSVL